MNGKLHSQCVFHTRLQNVCLVKKSGPGQTTCLSTSRCTMFCMLYRRLAIDSHHYATRDAYTHEIKKKTYERNKNHLKSKRKNTVKGEEKHTLEICG